MLVGWVQVSDDYSLFGEDNVIVVVAVALVLKKCWRVPSIIISLDGLICLLSKSCASRSDEDVGQLVGEKHRVSPSIMDISCRYITKELNLIV